ncbi:MAG: YqgE/AlgH family protein [Acidimicrobiales bacterium]
MPIAPFAPFEPYGGGSEPDSLSGFLLVATPGLTDATFFRRVVLVLDHGAHGALGVVIDRPGVVPVAEVLPHWDVVATAPSVVHRGGPVAQNALIGLVRLTGDGASATGSTAWLSGWHLLVAGDRPVGTVDLSVEPEHLADRIEAARIFAGYAGWGAGQLETEIGEDAWYVLPAEADDPISSDPEGLWRRVLRRQGGAIALVSGFPIDPAHN